MAEKRHWYEIEDPKLMTLALISTVHLVKQLLDDGKIEDAKNVVNQTIAETDKHKLFTTGG